MLSGLHFVDYFPLNNEEYFWYFGSWSGRSAKRLQGHYFQIKNMLLFVDLQGCIKYLLDTIWAPWNLYPKSLKNALYWAQFLWHYYPTIVKSKQEAARTSSTGGTSHPKLYKKSLLGPSKLVFTTCRNTLPIF